MAPADAEQAEPGLGLRWAVLIPLKPLASAKSRLAVADAVRTELVLAMACDTVAVALACPLVDLVLVVTDTAEGLDPLQRMGAGMVVGPGGTGLNAALRHAAKVAAARDSTLGIASLVADVAAATVDQLTRVLAEAEHHLCSFVADAAGSGTTLLAATQWGSFLPEYGPQSRRRHLEAGFVELSEPDITGLRLDVDTTADLRAAAANGVRAAYQQGAPLFHITQPCSPAWPPLTTSHSTVVSTVFRSLALSWSEVIATGRGAARQRSNPAGPDDWADRVLSVASPQEAAAQGRRGRTV